MAVKIRQRPIRTNNLTGKPMAKDISSAMDGAYEARLGARKMARSGHPGRKAEGRKGVVNISSYIRGLYLRDAQEAGQ